ncbi:cyclic-phosphate processing receiver domain-containing protein [Prescottella equi]|uniref:cyclic-phosphate processing receiver domain-containing protein n=1 Tax=Rhodococcus hoagii TaxID=43767 RepID=UPI000D0FED8C|nr:cyclic-phosphate processing receiver domain-containing protein [Prescottella equi]AVP71281.1 hypothetical protein C7H75_24680 [Prescottella equi]
MAGKVIDWQRNEFGFAPAEPIWKNLFVDDDRPAPEGWMLFGTAEEAIGGLESLRGRGETVHRLSLDFDLGVRGGTTLPVLEWMRDNAFWPRELYVHTASYDGEALLLEIIREDAPAGTLRGWGCNYWGTGPDSVERNHP